MDDLNEAEVKALADAINVNIPTPDLPIVVTRLNGMIGLLSPLESLPRRTLTW